MRRFRLARFYFRSTWRPWRAMAQSMKPGNRRETFLSYFGPLSLLVLFGVWAAGLILGFALLQVAGGSAISFPGVADPLGLRRGFWSDLYLSGTTFFTLGLGDVTPQSAMSRVVMVIEAGIGFGFLAVAITYLPVLYGAFSRREANISLLDARAGSPPTAAELMRRHIELHGLQALTEYLRDWEVWAAELMESHLSYPALCFFRSQHSNQSWLAALATMLDASALLITYGSGALEWQAKMTFAISRHALVDLAQVLSVPPRKSKRDRLGPDDLAKMLKVAQSAGIPKCSMGGVERLSELREMYEPFVEGLSERLLMPVAPWMVENRKADNWKTTAWARISGETNPSAGSATGEKDHF